MAIFNSGAAMGSVIAPLLVVFLAATFGWRIAFLGVGVLGFVWLAIWLWNFQVPAKHPRISQEELEYILEDRGNAKPPLDTARDRQAAKVTWEKLLKYRQVWAIVWARFLVDPIWWLFVIWLPEYLSKARGMSLKQIGLSAWAPYLAAAAGSLFGGWLAGRLIAGGMHVSKARKIVIGIAACLMPAGILAAHAQSLCRGLAFIGVVLFGFQMWISNVQTLPSDFFDDSAVGSVAGLGGSGATIGSMILILSTGWIVTNFSYAPDFDIGRPARSDRDRVAFPVRW